MKYSIETPLTKDVCSKLRVGDIVEISGVIYTGRDAAHKKMIEMLNAGRELPFDIVNQVIYYVGPCPAKPGEIIGSAGPTTSGRMDAYAPKLIELGLSGMIGKGLRDDNVIASMKKYGAVYFGAIGGAGALIAESIIGEEIVAFSELGTEAIRKLTVRNFPVTVVIDSSGNNLYESGKMKYRIQE
ncbi:MAG: Fe-S-containing hydro-lyase [Clostridiaceae bacterium]|nr:Fe-S-containing hydro-lyase [Clostridiaceae bacterium]